MFSGNNCRQILYRSTKANKIGHSTVSSKFGSIEYSQRCKNSSLVVVNENFIAACASNFTDNA